MRHHIFELFKAFPLISTDTRKIVPNSLFFALKGQNFNGNLYAKEALEKGAVYAIVDEKLAEDERIVYVENALLALQQLANDYRKASNFKVIGITGSNGKTTTKELLATVFQHFVPTYATPGNFNNHIGLPLTILQTPSNTEALILEMGDNKMGDIAELCEIAEPNFGLITNVGKDHIEGFGSFENNVLAKKELFDYIVTHQQSFYYDNQDEQITGFAKEYALSVGYSESSLGVTVVQTTPFLRLKNSSSSNEFPSNLYGDYNFKNILATLALSKAFNFPLDSCLEQISKYTPQNNRSQLIEKGSITLICDAYNANPSSMEVALHSFAALETDKKKVAILGDMFELGHLSEEEHLHVIQLAQSLKLDDVFFVGSNFHAHKSHSAFRFFENRNQLESFLRDNSFEHTIILLKASRGIALEKCIDFIQTK